MNKLNINELDLNIDHYDLGDILNLFHLNTNFTEEDMRKSKKKVLQTHPDKSGMKPEIFLFYSKAYKTLYSIWEFTNKHKKITGNTNYSIDETDDKHHQGHFEFGKEREKVLDHLFEKKEFKNKKNFHEWFNREFEKAKVSLEDEVHGYGDWLRSDENIDDSDLRGEEALERKKREIRDLVVHRGVHETSFHSNGGASINHEVPEYYTSDLFSNLHYEDLRKAHTETVVPVTMEDYHAVPKFQSIDEYKHYRSSQNIVPLSEIQANEYLTKKANMERHYCFKRTTS